MNYRDRTSALIRLDDGRNILIDATPDLRHQAIRHKVFSVDAVLYTHAHADHILGTDDLRSFNFVQHHRIPCYGSAATLAGVKACFGYIFNPDKDYLGAMLPQLDLVEITNEAALEICGVEITPFPLTHGNTIVTGFRVGNIGYATDCKSLSPRAYEVLMGVKHLFLDGLRYEPHRTHLTIPEAIAIAQELNAQHTYLIHTTHTIDYHKTVAQLPAGITLGYDGLTVPIE